MLTSRWLMTVFVAMTTAGVATAGCSSKSGSGSDARTDTINVGVGDTGGDRGSPDTGPPCTPVGVSAATLDAGATWGCFQQACSAALTTCASECVCNNAVIGALACVRDGGTQPNCFDPLVGAGSNGLTVVTCLSSSGSCGMRADAAGEAGDGGAVPEGGGERGGADGGADAPGG
jgi:hypothetical protein